MSLSGQLSVGLLMLLVCVGCSQPAREPGPNVTAETSQKPSPSPKQLTGADLSRLKWIEGGWRGSGGGVEPFFERYKFENDTTLLVETFEDDTLSKVTDATRFELKNGNFGTTAANSGSVATALDDTSITFAPLGKMRNSFRWQRESETSWKAILNWTDKDGTPKERVYNMERLPAKK